jgi:hypothetical protein
MIERPTLTVTLLIPYILIKSDDEVVYIFSLGLTAHWQCDSWRPLTFRREEVSDDGHGRLL